jgi:hypothetical protein
MANVCRRRQGHSQEEASHPGDYDRLLHRLCGSPACIEYCPIEACMFWVTDEDHPPFGRIE